MDEKVNRVKRQVEEHGEILDHHDRRISRNENWRLQAMGAFKTIAFLLGAGGLAVLGDFLLTLI